MLALPDKTRWSDQPAYVLGGGPSLSGFNFEVLRGRNVVGCNEAFTLGPAICPVLLFSDIAWFRPRQEALKEYHKAGGEVFTQCQKMKQCDDALTWVRELKRLPRGLGVDGLGFGGNSGCSAANLALLLGAKTVHLLGIDCDSDTEGLTHWHKHYGEKRTSPGAFRLFATGWEEIKQDLPKVFPGRTISNLGLDSRLEVFEKFCLHDHFTKQ